MMLSTAAVLVAALLTGCVPTISGDTQEAPHVGEPDAGDDGEDGTSATDGADGVSDGEDGAADGVDGEDTADSGDPPGPEVTADPYTVLGHAQECAVALGRVPGFSCADALEVPMPVGGAQLEDSAYSDGMRCDKPSMLRGDCTPWSRVGYVQGETWGGDPDPDVDWVYTCRRRNVSGGRDAPVYDDVAMIGHRKSTGETCFFQAFPYNAVERAPSPLELPEDTPDGFPTVRDFWMQPADTANISCGPRCHDNDPWIHSPWIDQVRRTNGRLVVPAIDDPVNSPYTVVGTAFSWWQLEQIKPDGNGCVSCHRMGLGGSCSTFTSYASGDPDWLPVTDHVQAFPLSHWMPPGASGSEDDWEATWRDSVAEILSCCNNPNATACNRQDIPSE